MLLDKATALSEAQAITATAASTNYLDLGATGTPKHSPAALKRDIGGVPNQHVLIQVVETFATLTSLTAVVQVDSDPAFGSPKLVATSVAVPVAELKAGKKFSIQILPPGADERYLRVYYTVAGSNATAGKVDAIFTTGHQTNV